MKANRIVSDFKRKFHTIWTEHGAY